MATLPPSSAISGSSSFIFSSPGVIERLPKSRFNVASTASSGSGKPESADRPEALLLNPKLAAARPTTAPGLRRKARRLKLFALLPPFFVFD
jgi:hypothetical protein